VWVSTVSNN